MAHAIKLTYICQNCGAAYAKPQGKCYTCTAWNTIIEEALPPVPLQAWESQNVSKSTQKPKRIQDLDSAVEERMVTPDKEFNRVLGGGIVPGSMVLLGGEPGIGKSTLLLQIALQLTTHKTLYVSGEESEAQVKMRASRLPPSQAACYILNETALSTVLAHANQLQPNVIIIDSIQTLYATTIDASAGSIAQIRLATAWLTQYAKSNHTAILMIGHITKEGTLAGPKALEHMVDTVLHFEGDRHLTYRILRTTKNRFGPTPEIGMYEMRQQGLQEVSNPSGLLLSQRERTLSGIATGAWVEGNRSLLIEVQALVSPTAYGIAQRTSTGFDSKRLTMLLAVLEKRAGLRLGMQDVFLNIAGGMKVEDPGLDLAICMAIAASFKDQIIPNDYCFIGEVGLGGEVRGIGRIEQRIAEASKLGFEQVFIARQNYKGLDMSKFTIHIQPVDTIAEAIAHFNVFPISVG